MRAGSDLAKAFKTAGFTLVRRVPIGPERKVRYRPHVAGLPAEQEGSMIDTNPGAALDGGPGAPGDLTDAEKLAALDTYIKVLTDTARKLRAAVTDDMGKRHVEKVGAFLPDGTKIASVTRSNGKKGARVVDEAAALAWCQNRYPGEVVAVEMIRPAFLARLLAVAGSLPADSKGIDPATGEELPFIQVGLGSPYVTVTKTDEGLARMTALARGFTRMLEAPTVKTADADEIPNDLSYEEQYRS